MIDKKIKQKRLSIVIYIILPLWVILTLFGLYKYIVFTSDIKATKWWTIVEWIFNNISYLPYWWKDEMDYFYQSLLFPKCLDYKYDNKYIYYTWWICNIKTKDYKKFYITVKSWSFWSDWLPVNADDVFFTYHKVLKSNIWNLQRWNKYSNIDVMQIDKNTISVIFPKENIDNLSFFTKNILPNHILSKATVDQYVNEFWLNPITRKEVLISPVQDKNSFVYDLTNDSNTLLAYYQLKRFNNIEEMANRKDLLIDIYKNPKKLPDWNWHSILQNKFVALFFNYNSKKTNKRIKRALWGLIISNIYTWKINEYLQKNNLYLDTFLSNWKNIFRYLSEYNPNLSFDRKDIENLKISELPQKIIVKKIKSKFVYYLDNLSWNLKIDIWVYSWEKYKNVKLQKPHSDKKFPIKLVKRHYFLQVNKNDLQQWANKYRFWWDTKVYDYKQKKFLTKTVNIADIDIYYIPKVIHSWDDLPLEMKNKIVYFKSELTNQLVKQLSDLFFKNNISKYFVFIWYDNPEDFENVIKQKKYDIVIRILNLWLKRDISNLLLTDNSIVNPSMYTNSNLSNYIHHYLLNKYKWNKKSELYYKQKIDKIYWNDIPFIILWQKKEKIFTYKTIKIYPFGFQDYYTLHKYIYDNIKLKKHYNPSWKNFWNKENFIKFLKTFD